MFEETGSNRGVGGRTGMPRLDNTARARRGESGGNRQLPPPKSNRTVGSEKGSRE
jgi:hypothetical protein